MGHILDALDLLCFVETVGTDGKDCGYLYAGVHQRGVDVVEHTSLRLVGANHGLVAALGPPGSSTGAALSPMALLLFADGVHDGSVGGMSALSNPGLQEFVLCDAVLGAWAGAAVRPLPVYLYSQPPGEHGSLLAYFLGGRGDRRVGKE
ncbi:hypothetical_protein [Leishmania braziliensis MHOM/BR/75/M2904]|uniref:Hypothetical_protein n=1 Tax=Leishmania braziliensis MHOM/BR/75/M2904 TaxID=420245 RepID=A0A3P3Z4M7_LEIBR|nr:unnamed protein product [Leishmania braziliensis]SYZ65160.1 hypothetical_protein [Leishmania braziliensis MHOM/BR/75/M2904]SYZ65165.1 hypothetical_protein [Leishmania braziliensis MHOM/BR/75/M2904]SYZ65178.1 hypothetical_protein [Leishmania braziliensis MHOM/BR/75/M2904]